MDDKFGCAEDDTDAIGDNDGVCELLQQGHGKKVWEECMEVCETPENNPAVTDCTTMDQMAGSLQDVADALESAGWEPLDDAITGARVDNMSLCVEEVGSQLNAMQQLLNAMNQKLITIMEYLNTPQWKRSYFPIN